MRWYTEAAVSIGQVANDIAAYPHAARNDERRRRGVDAELMWSAIDQELSVAEMRMVREMEWERTHGR